MKKLFASLFIIVGLWILIKIGFQSVIGLVIGIAAIGVGILLLFLKTKPHQSLHPSNSDQTILQLKENGDRLEVILDQCMISTDEMTKESIVRYRTFYKGKEHVYASPVVPFDKKTLVFGFTMKEKSMIYIDKTDPTVYYFDLEFMFDQPGL